MTELYIAGGSGVWATTAGKYIVVISGDGKTVASLSYVGVTGTSTTLYTASVTPTFTLIQKSVANSYAVAAGINAMLSLSSSYDGNMLVLSRLGTGSGPSQINVRTYDTNTSTWSNYTVSSTTFGFGNFGWDTTRVNEEGTKVYARYQDKMLLFNWTGSALTNSGLLIGSGMVQRETIMSRNSQYIIGSDTTTNVKVYIDTGSNTWVQRGANLIMPTVVGVTFTRFCISGAITNDGNNVVFTVSNGKNNNYQGFAYYTWDGTNYVFQTITNVLDSITDSTIMNYDATGPTCRMQISTDGTKITIGDDFTPTSDPATNKLSNSFVYFERTGSVWNPKESFTAYSFNATDYNIAVTPDFSSFAVQGTLGAKFGTALFVRQPPVAVNDSFGSINSNIPRVLNVKTNDNMKSNTGETLNIVSNGGLSLTTNSANGTVTLASGTAPGSYTFTYAWTTASGYVGNTASATLTVVSGAPTIVDDNFGNYVHGGNYSFNPVTNDDLKDLTLTNFNITNYGNASPTDLNVNSSTGQVNLLSTLPLGNHLLTYSITTSAGTTTGGTITFSIIPGPPIIVNDNFGNYVHGGSYSFNPVTNDSLDGATLTNFSIDSYGTASPSHFVVNSSTGDVNLLSSATIGSYSLTYSITTTGGTDTGGTIIFNVVSAPPVIVDDDFGTYLSGIPHSFNPVDNDILDSATLTNFTITNYNGANASDFTINASTGLVTVLATAPPGSYNLIYSITTSGGTDTGGSIVFGIVSSYTPIVLSPVSISVQFLAGATISVLTAANLGGRMSSDVQVIITNDDGSGAIVVNNQIVIPNGLPYRIYNIEFDVNDNATNGFPTGNPQFVTVNFVLYSEGVSIGFGLESVVNNTVPNTTLIIPRPTRCWLRLYFQALFRSILGS